MRRIYTIVIGIIVLLTLSVGQSYALPLNKFVPNQGQWDKSVGFVYNSGAFTLSTRNNSLICDYVIDKSANSRKGRAIATVLAGANLNNLKFSNPSKEYYNFFLGNDKSKWAGNIHVYDNAYIKNVYPGVDLNLLNSDNNPRYDFIVAPGTNPNCISFKFDGVDTINVADGEISLIFDGKKVTHSKLIAYQEKNGIKQDVGCKFKLINGNIKFEVEKYDKALPLVIDPTIYYTHIHSDGVDQAESIYMDHSGNILATGFCSNDNLNFLATTGAYNTVLAGGQDIFVAKYKIENNVRELTAMTYLGGTGDDRAVAVRCDQDNNIYISGYSDASNFPLVSSVQPANNGGKDVVVAKFDSSLTELLYSTYLGGKLDDIAYSMDVAENGDAYITGVTSSNDYPTQNGEMNNYQGQEDAFLTKLVSSGNVIDFSTYYGDPGTNDRGTAVDYDVSCDCVTLGIETNGTFKNLGWSYPANQSFDGVPNGGKDAMIVQFSTSGGKRKFYAFYGGTGDETINALKIDFDGSIYIAGKTNSTVAALNPKSGSTNFPVTATAMYSSNQGGFDGFFAKISEDGKTLGVSTYIGGKGDDNIISISKNSKDLLFVFSGTTNSSDFPINNPYPSYNYSGGADIVFGDISVTGSQLGRTTMIGGEGNDYAKSIISDNLGNYIMAISTNSAHFQGVVPDQSLDCSSSDGLIVKYSPSSIVINSPGANQTYCQGSLINIDWTNSEFDVNESFSLWYLNSDSVWTLANASMQTSPFVFNTSNLNAGNFYRFRITHKSGMFTESEPFSIKLTPTVTNISSNKPATGLCQGEAISFSVEASGEDIKYQWRKNAVNISGKVTSVLELTNLQSGDAGTYDCVVSNGCAPAATSAGIILNMLKTTNITKQPIGKTVKEKESFTISVTAEGSNLSYEWYKNSTKMLGQSNNSITVASAEELDEAEYYCKVIGDCGTIESDKVNVVVNPLESISNDTEGEFFSLSVNNGIFTIAIMPVANNANLAIYNSAGQIVRSFNISASNSEQRLQISETELPAGAYYVVINTGEIAKSLRFVTK